MSNTYLIPQFIIEYLEKSRSEKSPQWLASALTRKNLTPEIETWFKENEVDARYIWKFFVSQGKNEFEFKFCPVCGKRISLERLSNNPNTKYCSTKCQANSKEVREKWKQTILKRYGVENPSQSKEIQEKKVQTWLENYGVENPSQSKEIQEKWKQTNLKRYGVENPFQSKEVQEKIKQTNLKRYGVEYPMQYEGVQEKCAHTCVEKYEAETPLQSKKVREKSCQTRRSNHWETFCSLLKERGIKPLFSKEEYINDTGRKFKCLICDEEFESEGTCEYRKNHRNKDGSYSTLDPKYIHCPHCTKAPYSKGEKEVLAFVQSIYTGTILENDRTQLEGKELDIYLPKLNLGIEFDGDYWHSKEDAKERDSLKDSLCEEKGIRLLRIKESEWNNNRKHVESEIRVFLQTNQSVL